MVALKDKNFSDSSFMAIRVSADIWKLVLPRGDNFLQPHFYCIFGGIENMVLHSKYIIPYIGVAFATPATLPVPPPPDSYA